MRVFWISVGLVAGFLIALFGFVEPQPENAPQALNEQKVTSDSPFVEDAPSVAKSDQQVQLAVLPASTSTSSSSSSPGSSTNASSVSKTGPASGSTASSGVASQVKVATADNIKVSASAKVAAVQNSKLESNAENIEAVVVDKPQQAESPSMVKKPGLAMIMLEKEQQKNKVAVIVHETNSQKLTEKDIKALYLDRITRWQDGSRVILFNLPLGDKFRDKFSESVLKMTALEADKEENKRRELHIKANDVEVKSKNVIVSYVEQHPNAVAYVPLNLVRDRSSVKVVFTIP